MLWKILIHGEHHKAGLPLSSFSLPECDVKEKPFLPKLNQKKKEEKKSGKEDYNFKLKNILKGYKIFQHKSHSKNNLIEPLIESNGIQGASQEAKGVPPATESPVAHMSVETHTKVRWGSSAHGAHQSTGEWSKLGTRLCCHPKGPGKYQHQTVLVSLTTVWEPTITAKEIFTIRNFEQNYLSYKGTG